MNESDSDEDQCHAGYDLEEGIIARVREWTDLFPWIRLIRTLRIAASPPLLLLVAVTFAAWWPVNLFLVGGDGVSMQTPMMYSPNAMGALHFSPRETSSIVVQHVHPLVPTSLFDWVFFDRVDGSFLRGMAAIVWSLLVWSPAILLLVRQGALLTAGRPMVGLRSGFSAALQQIPSAWLVAFVPLACVLPMALVTLLCGWISRLAEGLFVVELPLALVVIVVAIPAGILSFGANVAVPLAWAALANERDRDALDSLSRGYEYLWRRPLHLVCYAIISVILMMVVAALAAAVTRAAMITAVATLELAGASETLPTIAAAILGYFPLVVMLTFFWSLVGGIYLLLRLDAGGQEVEDLWFPLPDTKSSLPQRSSDP